jgi:3-dehydroquinate synthase
MLAAAHISRTRGLLSTDDEARLADLIAHMGPLPLVTDLRSSEALDAVLLDKKVLSGRLHFVLASGLGATEIVADVRPKELKAAMRGLGMRD